MPKKRFSGSILVVELTLLTPTSTPLSSSRTEPA
jgi:hypothetical protein